MKKLQNQKGFTLMELMVVIVIVAILAAVAVPLYINYVKDAQRTEAKGAIGAISTAQQVYFQKSGIDGPDPAHYANDLALLEDNGSLDLTEAKAKWGFVIGPAPGGASYEAGYSVIATHNSDGLLKVCYEFTRTTSGRFLPDEDCGGTPAP